MLELYKNAAATVPSASTDRVRLFVDTDGMFYAKDAAGTVTSVGGGAVDSVNGQTGAVVLAAADVGAEPADATILKDADIGVTVQGYSAVLAGTTASFTTTDETKLDGIAPGATAYSDASVDTHLNTGTATTDQVLSWNGTDYDWVDQSGGGGGGALTISNKTAAYTVVAGDLGTIINCTSGTFTVSLTAAATLGSGFNCWVWNTSTTDTDATTIDPSGAETIDGRTTLILRRGEGMQIVCDGTNFQTGDKKTMRGYAENYGTDTRPDASGLDSLALGIAATASGARSTTIGYSSTASGSDSFAAMRSSRASGDSSIAIGYGALASASKSTAIGRTSGGSGSQAVGGSGAMALGGSYASGTDSFAAAIASNSSSYGATGANSTALGQYAKSSGANSVSLGPNGIAGGDNSFASGSSSFANGTQSYAIGAVSAAMSPYSYAIGYIATAQAQSAVAIGTQVLSSIIGKYAYAGGRFTSSGDAQTGTFVLRRATTDATATVLTTDNTAPGTNDQVILPDNSAYAFSGIIVARQQASGGTASAAWKVEGLIRREGSAGTTTLVASTVTAISNVPGWTLALSADTTNGGLKVEATGAAATNIRWVATIQTSEVSYA